MMGGIAKAARLGDHAVELHIRDPRTIDVQELSDALAAHKLAVSGVATGLAASIEGLTFGNPDRQIRRQAVERVEQQVDFCAHFGAQVLVGMMRGRLSDDPAVREQQKAWIGDCTAETDAYAHTRGAIIALEPINRYESNYLNRAEEVLEVIEKHTLRASGLLLDTFHMNIEEASIEEAILAAGRPHLLRALSRQQPPCSRRRAPAPGLHCRRPAPGFL